MLNRPAATINMFISISFSDKLLIHLCAIKRITICASLWLLIHYLFYDKFFHPLQSFHGVQKRNHLLSPSFLLIFPVPNPCFQQNLRPLHWNRVRKYVGLGTRSLQQLFWNSLMLGLSVKANLFSSSLNNCSISASLCSAHLQRDHLRSDRSYR